jgi:hypothetical protein
MMRTRSVIRGVCKPGTRGRVQDRKSIWIVLQIREQAADARQDQSLNLYRRSGACGQRH